MMWKSCAVVEHGGYRWPFFLTLLPALFCGHPAQRMPRFVSCAVFAEASDRAVVLDSMHKQVCYEDVSTPLLQRQATTTSNDDAPDGTEMAGMNELDALLAQTMGAFDLRQAICGESEGTIVIDGRLDEATWKGSCKLTLVDAVTGAPPLCGTTTGTLLWNHAYLYIGITAQDRNIWATMIQHDDVLSREEVIEVFIDPDGDQKNYIEIEVNPRNVVFDVRHF